ncbi:MAG TPA: hypothetical protein PKA19_07165 [Bacillota bacterium]|nr:hypothetical protein [Bacillota bacterium]
MGKAIVAAISTIVVSIIVVNLAGERFLYFIMPAVIVGAIVGTGAVLYDKIAGLENKDAAEKQDFDELIALRDIGLLSDAEIEEAIASYQKARAERKNRDEYEKHSRVLNELKETGYFTDAQYADRIDSLKEYFHIESDE